MIIGEAFIEVRPDAKGFGPETEKSVLSSVSKIAKRAGAIIATAFIVRGGASFFKDAIAGASDLAESITKNEVVFGKASDSVLRFAEGASTALGQSNAQALEATGVFGNLLRAVGLTEDKSSEFSTTLVTLASDLASFNNTSVDDALLALRSGLVGETEPLKRFGVNMNEAVLKAKALELGLFDGTGQLDANAKAQASYAVILEQTTLAQGDFVRTSGGLANQQRILSAQWDDLQAKIGGKFLPAVTAVVKFTNQSLLPSVEKLGNRLQLTLGPAFESVRDVVERLTQGALLPTLATELGKMVGLAEDHPAVSALAGAFESVASAAGTVIGAVTGVADKVISEIAERIGPVLETAKDAWIEYRDDGVGPIADVLDGIKELIEGITGVLEDHGDELLAAAAAAGTFVAAILLIKQLQLGVAAAQVSFALLGPAVTSALAPLVSTGPVGIAIAAVLALAVGGFLLFKNWEPFHDLVIRIADVIKNVAVEAFELGSEAVEKMGEAFETVAGIVSGVFDTITGVADFGAIFGGITDAVGGVVDAVADIDFGGIFDTIGDAVGGVADTVIEALEPITEWLEENLIPVFEAAGGFFDALFDRLADVVNIFVAVFEGAFDLIGVVIENMIDIITPFVKVYVAGLKLIIGLVKDRLVAAFKIARPIVTTVLKLMQIAFETIAKVAIPAFLLAIDLIGAVVKTVFNAILAIIESTLQTIQGVFQVGEGILRGDFSLIWEGLENIVKAPFEAILKIITGTFDEALGFIKGVPGRLGEIVSGLWGGINEATQVAFDGIKEIVTGTFDAIVELVKDLPGRLLEFLGSIGDAANDIGAAIIDKMFEGMGALGGKVLELSSALLDAVETLGKSLINGVIRALNDLLPDSIGSFSVKGITIFPGLDLPDDPIDELATGAIIRARPGGIVARIGEGSRNEGVFPLPPGVLEGLAAIGRNGGGTTIEAGAIQVIAPDTPAALIVNDVLAQIGWRLSARSDG